MTNENINSTKTYSRRDFIKSLAVTSVVCVLGASASIMSTPVDAKLGRLIRYRTPRIPRTPPRIRLSARQTQGVALAQKRYISKARSALTVSPSTARTQIRNSLNLAAKRYKLGRSWNAHHVVYWDFRKHQTMRKAAKGGFNINGVENGLRIPKSVHKDVHSQLNDASNRKQIRRLLDELETNKKHYTPAQTATVLRNNVRDWKYDVMQMQPLMKGFNKEV